MNNPLSARSTSCMRLYDAFGIVRTLPLRAGESGADKRDRGASDAVVEGESQTKEGPDTSALSEASFVAEEDPAREGASKRKSVKALVMLAGMLTLAMTSPVVKSSVVTCSV